MDKFKVQGDGLESAWASALIDGRFSDVTFRVGGTDFPIARLPFALASPVFGAMLFPLGGEGSQWEEHKSNAVITLEDCSAEGFQQLARFVYRLDMDLTPENVFPTRVLADRYQVVELVSRCADVIEAFLKEPDSSLILLDSEMHHTGAAERTGVRVLLHGHRVWRCNFLQQVREQTLRWLLSNSLAVREDTVWTACRQWASRWANAKQTDWQEELRPILSLLRLPLISPDILDCEIISPGLLSHEESVRVLLHARGTVVDPNFLGARFGFDENPEHITLAEARSVATQNQGLIPLTPFSAAKIAPVMFRGVHSFTITWETCGVPARVSFSSGKQDDLQVIGDPLVGFDCSAFLRLPKRPGTRVAITVNLEKMTFACQSCDGLERSGNIDWARAEGGLRAFIVMDGSSNEADCNKFRIQSGIHL